MNFSLAREIYGLNAWCIDSQSLPYLTSILRNIQNGVDLEIPDQKYNSMYLYDIKSKETRLITDYGELRNDDNFDAIGVIKLNGPITKGGGASSYGTKDLSSQMLRMAQDNRIKGFVQLVDSGGGSSNAVSLLSDTINEVKKTKPVYTLVEKGGIMASAAYGIGSAGNKIFAEDKMSIIGSVGTMISFEGRASNSVSKDGVKNIVIYATKSTQKNKAFEEALNNDNYELIINELLDPINESFINLVQSNRPQLKGTDFDDGHTKFAKDSVGTFIDGIASFDEVVQMVLNDSKNYTITNNNSSLIKSQKMTREELKQNHPDVYNSIANEGVTNELERVKSWMVFAKADLEAVTNGIESGKAISPSEMTKLMVKLNSAQQLANLQNDSANAVVTGETPTGATDPDSVENKELEEAFKFDLKLK
ncbi:hypothetical protein [Flavobacterium phage V157]|uniref:Peptidase S49 domain-containing protein n=20 Tax=Ficleduovirus TaxID=2560131 RepID=A0A0A0YNM5_9CAUD|nr:head maturation protease [Flavobacterium phage FCL-2]YP_009591107.1 head maturation protease [Flavobacterium phage FCV-1]ASD51605.1 hypothetical protein [Flavobacterium phage FCV-3]ASD51679.1 hypothetical protein [Flavobacterium phage FCV-11]ASD51753.1 hypothetical protein [Flavobacterium phage V175]ASD51831.1 hypothetical protein [Flavobacterium phage V181]ASD52509.1 hypothetical protein [Flavobacterium phage FCV-10]ASD52582.1 hypothetical protein [Flavobacterium phage FCV-16]ASD52656.1